MLSQLHLAKAYILRKSFPKLMPPEQLVLALSQEDPELPPSREEINKKQMGAESALVTVGTHFPVFSLSFNFLVCLSDHEIPGMTPIC